jgi:hypothetical protein
MYRLKDQAAKAAPEDRNATTAASARLKLVFRFVGRRRAVSLWPLPPCVRVKAGGSMLCRT